MTIDETLACIKNIGEWKEAATQVSPFAMEMYCTTFAEADRVYKYPIFKYVIYHTKNEYAHEWVPFSQQAPGRAWMEEYYAGHTEFLSEISHAYDNLEKKNETLLSRADEDITRATNIEILKELEEHRTNARLMYGYGMLANLFDDISLPEYEEKIGFSVPEKVRHDILASLTAPEGPIFFDREKLSLYRIGCKKLTGASKEEITQLLKTHASQFFWIKNGFLKSVILTEDYFSIELDHILQKETLATLTEEVNRLETLQSTVHKRVEEIIHTYTFSEETQRFFEMVRFWGITQDRRKEYIMKQAYCFDVLLEEIGRRYGVPLSDMKNYFLSQIKTLVETGAPLTKNELDKNKNVTFFSYLDKGHVVTDYFYGEESDKIYDAVKVISNSAETQELKGFVASKGIAGDMVRGRVKIILDPYHADITEEEILVTSMTRPEYLPLMKKAKGIVTNEGGITSHAAIVSRELKKPCIIGTKNATALLKSGEYITMNLSLGVVSRK